MDEKRKLTASPAAVEVQKSALKTRADVGTHTLSWMNLLILLLVIFSSSYSTDCSSNLFLSFPGRKITNVLQGNSKQIIIIITVATIFGCQRHQETKRHCLNNKSNGRNFINHLKQQSYKKRRNCNKSCSSVSVLWVDLLIFVAMFNRVGVSELVLFPQGFCGIHKLGLGTALVIGKEAWSRKTGQCMTVLQQCLRCRQALPTSEEKNFRNPPMMLASVPLIKSFNCFSSWSSTEAGPACFFRVLTISSVGGATEWREWSGVISSVHNTHSLAQVNHT